MRRRGVAGQKGLEPLAKIGLAAFVAFFIVRDADAKDALALGRLALAKVGHPLADEVGREGSKLPLRVVLNIMRRELAAGMLGGRSSVALLGR